MKQLRDEMSIDSIILNENVIIVNVKNNWYQEDILQLQQLLLDHIDSIIIQERIIGADRESIRFVWQSSYHYLLNFDYYSQSCWFESQDEISVKQLKKLLTLLQ